MTYAFWFAALQSHGNAHVQFTAWALTTFRYW